MQPYCKIRCLCCSCAMKKDKFAFNRRNLFSSLCYRQNKSNVKLVVFFSWPCVGCCCWTISNSVHGCYRTVELNTHSAVLNVYGILTNAWLDGQVIHRLYYNTTLYTRYPGSVDLPSEYITGTCVFTLQVHFWSNALHWCLFEVSVHKKLNVFSKKD